jgi:hypothetical protein
MTEVTTLFGEELDKYYEDLEEHLYWEAFAASHGRTMYFFGKLFTMIPSVMQWFSWDLLEIIDPGPDDF